MSDLFFEMIIKDESYRKIGTWKFHKKDAGRFFRVINEQFGLGLKISDSSQNKDLDWLK